MEVPVPRFGTLQGLAQSRPRRRPILRVAALCVLSAATTGCVGIKGDPVQRVALTTFTNETSVDVELGSFDRTHPSFSTTLKPGESFMVESPYAWDEFPKYVVRADVGRIPQAVRLRRVQESLIQAGDTDKLNSEHVIVRLVDDNGRLRARAERGIEISRDSLP